MYCSSLSQENQKHKQLDVNLSFIYAIEHLLLNLRLLIVLTSVLLKQ